jgi:hypothetical protein
LAAALEPIGLLDGLPLCSNVESSGFCRKAPQSQACFPFALVPKELNVAVEQKTPGSLEVEEWQILRRVVDLIKANAPGGELGPTLQRIENALRADQAKLIEAE